MKHLFIGLVTALLVLCSYVSMSAQNIVGERAYHIYQSFYGATQTGLLTDKSLGALNPRDFSKTVMDSTNKMSAYGFESLYLAMMLAQTDENQPLPDAGPLYADGSYLKYPGGLLPLSAMALRYDYIRPDALDLGLVTFGQDSVLVPQVPVTSLLRVDTVFAVGPQRDIIYSDSVTFLFPKLAENLSVDLTGFYIDAGDGTGEHFLAPGGSYTAVYSENGNKHIEIRPTNPTLSTLKSHFDVDIQHNFAQSSPPPITSYDQKNPIHTVITAEQAYLGETAQADLYLFPHCTDGKIRKPFLIIDGFEPGYSGNSSKFGEIFYDDRLGIPTLIGSTDGITIPAYQALFNEGYDLLFLDYKDSTVFDHYEGLYNFIPEYDEFENPIVDPVTGTPVGTLVFVRTDTIYKTIRRGGQDYIQRNAYMVESAIKYVNDQLVENNASHNKLNIAALSMGGLVTRWAILDMEERGMDHNIDNFWSWDSPLNGANIPAGLQAMIQDFYTMSIYITPFWKINIRDVVSVVGEKHSILTSPAASQMLIYRQDGGTGWNNFGPLNTEFSNKGRDRDGDIKNCSWKAIANGSLLPSNIDMNNEEVPFNPGDVLATFHITGGNTIIKKDKNIWDELVDLGLGLLAGSNLRINGTIFSQRNSGTSLVYHRDVYVGILGHNAKDDTEFTEVNDSRPIDCSNSSFTTLGQDVDLVKFKVFCNGYVPVFSSLAVRANPLVQFNTDFSDVSSIINSNLLRVESYVGPVSPLSSFTTREDGTHETYRSQLNQLHCFNSDRSFAFLAFDLLTAAKLSLSELDHQTFNFGNLSAELEPSYDLTMFQPKKMYGNISQSILVKNNSMIGVNMGGQLGLSPGANLPNNLQNSEFIVNILAGGCEDGAITVTVDNTSKFQVGDEIIANKGLLNIGYNATLDVSGTLDVRPESKITILNGGRLIIRSGTLLNMDSAQIIVEKGGHLIIEDNPIIHFTASSKIIVEGELSTHQLNIHNMNGFFFIKEDGRWLVNGDLTLSGIDREQEIIRLAQNASCLFEVVNVAISQGKIQSVLTSNDGFTFEKGASNVTFSNVVFQYGSPISIAGNLNGVFSATNCDYNDVSKSAYINGLGSSYTGYQVVVSDCKVFNSATPNSGFIIQNIKNVNVTNSEFYSDKPTWSSIYSNGGYGLDLQTVERLDLTSCHFAKLNTGITNNSADVRMQCTYFINCIYGAVTGSFFENTDFIMNQSGMIGNRLGAQLSLTNLDINTPAPEWYLGNIYSDCCYPTETMLFIPDKYQKNPERDSNLVNNPGVGGRDIPGPQLPECGYIFRGTVVNTPDPMTGMIPAEYNYWYDGPLWTCTSNKSDLQLVPSGATISLNTEPENTIGDMRDITTCTWILNPRSPESSKSTKSDVLSQLYLVPNPASDQLLLACQERFTGWLSLKNISGNEVLKQQVNESTRVNISGLIPGIYFAHINDASNNITVDQKIIIVR